MVPLLLLTGQALRPELRSVSRAAAALTRSGPLGGAGAYARLRQDLKCLHGVSRAGVLGREAARELSEGLAGSPLPAVRRQGGLEPPEGRQQPVDLFRGPPRAGPAPQWRGRRTCPRAA